jgi:hypothetical protein
LPRLDNNLYVPFKILLSSLFFPPSLLKIESCEKKKIQITAMSQNHPSPRSPNAPLSDVTNNAVVFALVPPPSPLSPASPQRSGATNLFQECSEKQASDLALTGYSPAKKKGGRCIRGAGISPRDADLIAKAFPSDEDDDDYVPTQTVSLPPPKKKGGGGDAKVILDSNVFTYLCPSTFDKDLFICGHPTVYSEDEMVQFDANYQKQLSFDFCASRATRKKAAAMQDARASRLRDIDLDVTPTLFSLATTDCHELSRYILEDLLSHQVGSRFIVCIRVSATGNPTEASYSDQALHIVEQRKRNTKQLRRGGWLVMRSMLCRERSSERCCMTNLQQPSFLQVVSRSHFSTKMETLDSRLRVALQYFPSHGMMSFIARM